MKSNLHICVCVYIHIYLPIYRDMKRKMTELISFHNLTVAKLPSNVIFVIFAKLPSNVTLNLSSKTVHCFRNCHPHLDLTRSAVTLRNTNSLAFCWTPVDESGFCPPEGCNLWIDYKEKRKYLPLCSTFCLSPDIFSISCLPCPSIYR